MRNHNHINQRNHPKYNGYPFILLSVCGIIKVSVYNLVRNKQLLDYREYPDPYKGGYIVGVSMAMIGVKGQNNKDV